MIPGYEILTQCVTQAQDGSKIDLTGEDGSAGIIDAHIFAIKVPYGHDQRQRFAITPRPALVFVAPLTINSPLEAGTDQTAVVYYNVLAQILHTSLSVHLDVTLKNVLKWEQQVRRYFHTTNLRAQVMSATDGMMILSSSGPDKTFDIKDFHVFDDCVSAIPISFQCWEAHDEDGRV
jgi:hypothetical protein